MTVGRIAGAWPLRRRFSKTLQPADAPPARGFSFDQDASVTILGIARGRPPPLAHWLPAVQGASLFLGTCAPFRRSIRRRKDGAGVIRGGKRILKRCAPGAKSRIEAVSRRHKKIARGHEFPGSQFAGNVNIVSPSRTVNGCW